ncbi:MAG TPA: methyltransferase domain-containing protein [Longimicrobiales bacterium]|nr:methyltransferase domain-containing protein [Longimicrobiales bacterium]
MSHSVRRHLHLEVREYDAAIRRFIPGYEEMLAVAAREALDVSPHRVLDLGSGTGALAAELLERSTDVQVELLDADPEMLDRARERLSGFGPRAAFRTGSFTDPLPAADAVTASLSLHHIPEMDTKVGVFRRIAAAIPADGVFVNADVTLPGGEADRAASFRDWASHLVACGIPEERAWRHFEEWSGEDTYFPVEEEMAAMKEAGLEPRLVWSDRVVTVVSARKG